MKNKFNRLIKANIIINLRINHYLLENSRHMILISRDILIIFMFYELIFMIRIFVKKKCAQDLLVIQCACIDITQLHYTMWNVMNSKS